MFDYLRKGCEADCATCNGEDGGFESPLRHTRLCSWAEEEINEFDDGRGLDYGFLRRIPPSTNALPKQRGVCHDQPLVELGSMVQMRSSQKSEAKSLAITDLYELSEKPFGRGSYGEVLNARQKKTGARRAVKTVGKAGLAAYVKDVSGFVRKEVEFLRRLDHPNVVRLYEAFEDEETIYIVLEFCDGGDLLERVTVTKERMSEGRAALIMKQTLSAVQHVTTRGIVHRDVKPENFMFAKREPESEPFPPLKSPVKLIDFGLSRKLGVEIGSRLTPKIGTTEYMAPEAFSGRITPGLVDRTDVWSLGVVLHVIFIGHFPSPKLVDLAPADYFKLPCWKKISLQGRDLLCKMLHYDPVQRPSVSQAMKHPWLSQALQLSQEAVEVVRMLPGALSGFARTSDFRKLALIAAAREANETSLYLLRDIFYSLEVACGGPITRMALTVAVNSLPGPISAVAAELLRNFDFIDVVGSKTIDWSEFLASVVGASFLHRGGRRTPAISGPDACLRAFDLLSQGADTITKDSLERLFSAELPKDVGSEPSAGTGSTCDRTESSGSGAGRCFHRILREVQPDGAVNRSRFMAFIRGN